MRPPTPTTHDAPPPPPPPPPPGGAAPTAEAPVDPRHLLRLLWGRRWLLVATTGACLLLGAVHLRRAEPVYSATAQIRYEPNRRALAEFAGIEDGGAAPQEINTQLEVLRSPRVLGRVVESLGLDAPSAEPLPAPASPATRVRDTLVAWKNELSRRLVSFDIPVTDPELSRRDRAERALAAAMSVRQVPGTRVITITFSHARRETAARIANEVAAQYIQYVANEKQAAYGQLNENFGDQLLESEERLRRAEMAVFNYKGSADIRVLEQNHQIASETMKDLARRIDSMRTELRTLRARNAAADDPTLWPSLLADANEYAQLRRRLEEVEFQRLTAMAQNTAAHPEVKRLDREHRVLQEKVEAAARAALDALRAREQLMARELASLEERLAEQTAVLESLQAEMVQFRVLEREAASSREIHSALLARSKQLAVDAEIAPASVSLLTPARVPEYPSSPRIMQTLALFGLFGFALGCGLVVLAERLDRTVRDPRQVEERLGLPTLAVLPHFRTNGSRFSPFGRRSRRTPLIAADNLDSPEAEAFRMLRTALQYSTPGHPPKVLLFTSCFPREGKSTLAANLALSHALRGDRTLLIDCDLKRPVAHETFGLDREPGLSDVLTGQQPIEAVLREGTTPRLTILTAGHVAPSPGDLLESATMTALLADLRTRYDRIILDTPPVGAMADALVLSREVDGICLVVNRGSTPFDALSKVHTLLGQVQAPVLGVVYNATQRRRVEPLNEAAYGYGYSYRYGKS